MVVVVALIASVAITTLTPTAPAVAAPDATVSGKVFKTYNISGWETEAALGKPGSSPLSGVTVSAFDAEGDLVGTTQSGVDGDYTIPVAEAFSKDLRVEFSGWAEELDPAFAAQGSPPRADAAGNDTSVQFVTLDAQGKATGVDFALFEPEDTIQDDAPVATAIQSAGNITGNSKDLAALVAQPWSTSGTDPVLPKLATFGDIGSVWGTSYARLTNELYAAASLKRMSGLGPLGLGGMYRTTNVLQVDGKLNANARAENWFSFDGISVANGGKDEKLDIGSGKVLSNEARGLKDAGTPVADANGFANVARVGLGGIATSPDGRRLFVTNLYDGQVYASDISQGAEPTHVNRVQTRVVDGQAVWALSVYRDRLYVGYVDTGDNVDKGVHDPGRPASAAKLHAYVDSIPLSAVADGMLDPTQWREEIVVNLAGRKGSNIQRWMTSVQVGMTPAGKPKYVSKSVEEVFPRVNQWNSWTDLWHYQKSNGMMGEVSIRGTSTSPDLHSYPQAVLSGIAFDSEGYMNLGFTDRTGLQSGNRSLATMDRYGDRAWTTVANGDVLVAAPASRWEASIAKNCPKKLPSGNFILECAGKVGDREVREEDHWKDPKDKTEKPQRATFKNVEGPGRGEFYNDRRNMGTETVHNEVALGSVVAYPGLSGVATTAIDPLDKLYRSGLMWFEERTGLATRGVDLSVDDAGAYSTSFQKAGGLGGVTLLALAAPVEIGNRVWLDADLNGRQDADEPAINGAKVELWTADENGDPVARVGTRTTKTIDGQGGTYYFRSDDPDLIVGANPNPFLKERPYMLVFEKGESLTLTGPNARHPGFAGMTWESLERTVAEARQEGTATHGGTTALNDSNPDPATGRAKIQVRGSGENDHSFDAGWFAANTYSVQKNFNPSTIQPTQGAEFSFTVVKAENFRGQERLAQSGAPNQQDPQVDANGPTAAAPTWLAASTQRLPAGYQLELEEVGAKKTNMSWANPVAGNPLRGSVLMTPVTTDDPAVTVNVTNDVGRFTVKKTVSGPASGRIDPETKFQIEYRLNGGDPKIGWVSPSVPLVVDAVPLDTKVEVREVSPIVTDPVVKGIEWGTPVWNQVPGVSGPDAEGWRAFTLDRQARDISMAVRNEAKQRYGALSVTKIRDAGEPDSERKFNFEYRIGADGATRPLGPIGPGETATTTKTLPEGEIAYVREVPLLDEPNIVWKKPVWTGMPAGAQGPDADGWYFFEIMPDVTGKIELTAENEGTKLPAKFSVLKSVETWPGTPEPVRDTFDLQYRIAPAPAAGAAPVFGEPVPFQVKTGVLWESPEFTQDSIVEVLEVQPEDTPGTFWKPPKWTSPSGHALTQVNGWTRVVVNSAATIQFNLENKTEKPTSFSVRKVFAGTGTNFLANEYFDVKMQIDDGPVEIIRLKGDGERWENPIDLPPNTVVKLQEIEPTIPNYTWGDPEWSASGGVNLTDENGWTVFTTSETKPYVSLTLENKPNHLVGKFQFKKTLKITGNPQLPRDYQFEYRIGDASVESLTLAAGQSSPLFDNIPFNTTVKIREITPPSSPSQKHTREWKINGAKATEDADGWVSFEVKDEAGFKSVAVEIENDYKELYGGFQVTKTVSGEAKDLVPDDTEFTFEYTLDGGAVQTVTATPGKLSEKIGNIPDGTIVTIKEGAFPVVPGVEFGPDPTWTINGVPTDKPVKFTIKAETLVELGVDNPTTPKVGTFRVTKILTGDAKERVPEDATFQVQYSVDGGTTWKNLPVMKKGNLTVDGPTLRVGTQVILSELEPAAGIDFEWKDPKFFIGANNQGTTARFEIAPDEQVVDVELKNRADGVNGTFDIVKKATGQFALHYPELSGLTFDVNWTGGGREGVIHLNQANDWINGPGAIFPAGTVITLTEADVKGLPSHVKWEGPKWTDGIAGVKVSPDGKRATLTIEPKKTAHLELKNKFDPRVGTFGVKKIIDGDYDHNSPEIQDRVFKAKWVASNGSHGELTLNKDGDWQAEAGRTFPVDTTVTLTEVPVDQSSLPDHVKWGGYAWESSPDYTVSKDGQRASFKVKEDTSVRFKLKNKFTKPKDGSFQVSKKISGDVDLTDPRISGQVFTVNYETDADEAGTLELGADNGWSEVSKKFPVDTVITLTEVTPSGLDPSIKWEEHTWLPATGVDISADGHSATFTVQPTGKVLKLELENKFTERPSSGFEIEKVVTGDMTLEAPDVAGMVVTVSYKTDTGKKGTLVLDAAGDWKAKLAEKLDVGTVVTLKESKVDGLPPSVTWKKSKWVPGDGYTVSKDGRTATLTIFDRDESEQPDPKLILDNRLEYDYGTFELTKKVEGPSANDVPNDLKFVAEYSIDGGATWVALDAMTKAAPKVNGPDQLLVGTEVLIRERAPEPVPGVTWKAPVFSGTGVIPSKADAPASFRIVSGGKPLQVTLTNPTNDLSQFTLKKVISGAGESALRGKPASFTVRYTYDGQKEPGEFTLKPGETFSSEALPVGTKVTITELTPSGDLEKGLKWGTPALVLPNGSVFKNGATFTISESGSPLQILLENPAKLPETGATSSGFMPVVGGVLLAVGAALVFVAIWGRRRRKLA